MPGVNPGRLSYGHVGVGAVNQLTGELFKQLAELPEVMQVPYRGAGPTMADLIGGQLAMAVEGNIQVILAWFLGFCSEVENPQVIDLGNLGRLREKFLAFCKEAPDPPPKNSGVVWKMTLRSGCRWSGGWG